MNSLTLLLAALLALATVGGVNYYLAKRCFQCLSFLIPDSSLIPYLILFALLSLLMFFGFIRSQLPIPAAAKHILAVISSYEMGFFAYFIIFTVLSDIILLILQWLNILSPATPSLRFVSGIIVLALTIITVGYGTYHGHQLNIITYNVPIDEKTMNQDWNIVMISDLHLGAVDSEKRLSKIVDKINNLEPDLVCIAGDFFDNDFAAIKNPQKAIETLRQLKSEYGVYACLGNHDAGATVLQMQQFLEQCNIYLLNDAYTTVRNELVIVGRLDPSPINGYGDTKLSRRNISEVLSGTDPALPILVLDHNPANIEEYGNEVDLILSGHTHRGQLFPGSLITKALFTVDYGYYRKDAASPHVIVSSGVSTWGMPMRIGSDCEIVQIRLVNGCISR